MAVKFTPIVANELDEEIFLNALEKAVRDEIKASGREFAKTYRTWQHKPNFKQGFSQSSSEIEGLTTTGSRGSKTHPYPFVTKGTSVRYATMTPDFQAKSIPRVIGSRSGRGGLLYVNKNRPRPGIKARGFEEEIAKREQPKFERRGQKALDTAAKRSKHSI